MAGLPAVTDITDIAVSPDYTTDQMVFALARNAGGTIVLASAYGGSSFAQLGGTIGSASETGTSLSINPTYISGNARLIVGTVDPAAGVYGDVYVWGENGVLAWVPLGLDKDVTAVAFSPLYPIDATMIAVGSDAAGTTLNFRIATNSWNPTTLPAVAFSPATETQIISSTLAVPSDYNASIAFARNLFVGTNSAADGDDVFRVNNATVTDLDVTALSDNDIDSLAYTGNYSSSGILYVTVADGGTLLYRSTNANASSASNVAFSPAGAGMTGTAPASIAMYGSMVFLGTSGVESALNVSLDNGISFSHRGLFDATP